jgi:hypothetical protein
MEQVNIFKINIENLYLKDIKKHNILFKHTAEGVLFTKINKKNIKNTQLLNFFSNFTQPMYEVLLSGLPTKIYLDCDFNNLTLPQFSEKEKIINNLNNYLINFLNSKSINTSNIIYSDASRKKTDNTYKISLHIVVNNIYIKNRKLLKELIKEFQSTLSNDILYYNSIDTTVYNQPQLFKCLLSPSKDDNTLLKPFKIENNNIIYYNNNYIINNIYDFLVGLYKYEYNFIDNNLNYSITKENENIEKSINNKRNVIEKSIKSIIPENKKNWILNNNHIKNIYKIRNNYIIDNKIDLLRISSAYCKICDRFHDNENAYCKITENSIFFHCGRNTSKGVGIGFWYSNYINKSINNGINKSTNTNDNDPTVLNTIINEMKEYINNLESKYDVIKKELNLLNTIHNKCNISTIKSSTTNTISKKYTKDINSEMWQKYYRLGKYIHEGYDDLVDNIKCQWRDGSWGRLKKRGLLIYEYINYINNNNILNTISMRRIFHKKTYENFSSLL